MSLFRRGQRKASSLLTVSHFISYYLAMPAHLWGQKPKDAAEYLESMLHATNYASCGNDNGQFSHVITQLYFNQHVAIHAPQLGS